MFCLPLIYHMASEEIYSAWVILTHVMKLNAFVYYGSHITSIEIAEGENRKWREMNQIWTPITHMNAMIQQVTALEWTTRPQQNDAALCASFISYSSSTQSSSPTSMQDQIAWSVKHDSYSQTNPLVMWDSFIFLKCIMKCHGSKIPWQHEAWNKR